MSVRDPSRRKTLKYGAMAALGLGAVVALGDATGANRFVHAASPSGPDPVFSGTGIQFPSLTSDPSALVGNMWYRSDLTAMKYSDGTNAHELAALDLAQTWTGVQTFDGTTNFGSAAATSTDTLVDSPLIYANGAYWTGSASQTSSYYWYVENLSGTPTAYPELRFHAIYGAVDTPQFRVNPFGFNMEAGMWLIFQPNASTSTTTTQDSSLIDMLGSYWDGSASTEYGFRLLSKQDSTTPTAHLSFNLNDNGTLTELLKMDDVGNFNQLGVYHTEGGTYPSAQLGDGFVKLGSGGTTPLQQIVSTTNGNAALTVLSTYVQNLVSGAANTEFAIYAPAASTYSTLSIIGLDASSHRNAIRITSNPASNIIASESYDGLAAQPLLFQIGTYTGGLTEAFRITTTPDLQVSTALRMWTGSATSLTIAPSTGSLSKLMTLGGGTAPTTPTLTSGTAYTASTTQNTIITVGAGTVTAIAINGTTTGLTAGTFYLKASDTITVTFTTAPTVLQMVA